MNVVVRDNYWNFTMNYVRYKDFNANVVGHVGGLEYDLLNIVCEQINLRYVYVLQKK
jgi:hypothetical protein